MFLWLIDWLIDPFITIASFHWLIDWSIWIFTIASFHWLIDRVPSLCRLIEANWLTASLTSILSHLHHREHIPVRKGLDQMIGTRLFRDTPTLWRLRSCSKQTKHYSQFPGPKATTTTGLYPPAVVAHPVISVVVWHSSPPIGARSREILAPSGRHRVESHRKRPHSDALVAARRADAAHPAASHRWMRPQPPGTGSERHSGRTPHPGADGTAVRRCGTEMSHCTWHRHGLPAFRGIPVWPWSSRRTRRWPAKQKESPTSKSESRKNNLLLIFLFSMETIGLDWISI